MIKDIKELAGKAVHCETLEETITLFKILNDLGLTWGSGKELNHEETHWSVYKHNTDYLIDKNCKGVTYGQISYCLDHEIPIIEFKDLDVVDLIKEIYIPGKPTLQSTEREKILRAMLNTSEEKNKN